MSPFDYVNDILSGGKDIIKNSENPELAEKLYVPFIVNKALSNHLDCVLYANEMNGLAFLDHRLQHAYFLNSIRKMKRKHAWYKKSVNDDLELVQSYFQCNPTKAKQLLTLLSADQIQMIRAKTMHGGVKGK